jgi:hypothetical protein
MSARDAASFRRRQRGRAAQRRVDFTVLGICRYGQRGAALPARPHCNFINSRIYRTHRTESIFPASGLTAHISLPIIGHFELRKKRLLREGRARIARYRSSCF